MHVTDEKLTQGDFTNDVTHARHDDTPEEDIRGDSGSSRE